MLSLIADPIFRYLLVGSIPLLLFVAWWSLREQFGGTYALRALVARLRYGRGGRESSKTFCIIQWGDAASPCARARERVAMGEVFKCS
jgi:hypothetical protein